MENAIRDVFGGARLYLALLFAVVVPYAMAKAARSRELGYRHALISSLMCVTVVAVLYGPMEALLIGGGFLSLSIISLHLERRLRRLFNYRLSTTTTLGTALREKMPGSCDVFAMQPGPSSESFTFLNCDADCEVGAIYVGRKSSFVGCGIFYDRFFITLAHLVNGAATVLVTSPTFTEVCVLVRVLNGFAIYYTGVDFGDTFYNVNNTETLAVGFTEIAERVLTLITLTEAEIESRVDLLGFVLKNCDVVGLLLSAEGTNVYRLSAAPVLMDTLTTLRNSTMVANGTHGISPHSVGVHLSGWFPLKTKNLTAALFPDNAPLVLDSVGVAYVGVKAKSSGCGLLVDRFFVTLVTVTDGAAWVRVVAKEFDGLCTLVRVIDGFAIYYTGLDHGYTFNVGDDGIAAAGFYETRRLEFCSQCFETLPERCVPGTIAIVHGLIVGFAISGSKSVLFSSSPTFEAYLEGLSQLSLSGKGSCLQAERL